MSPETKTLVQCDFDGTATIEDASFVLLDAFSSQDWRALFRDYQAGQVSVGRFNAETFNGLRQDREALLEVVRREVRLRPGFTEFVTACRELDYRLVVVSNGLRFYIDDILHNAGIDDIEVHAAETVFSPEGLEVYFTGPDGERLDDDFKLAYTKLFLKEGFRIIYIGDGGSDLAPARRCRHVFATGSLLRRCREMVVPCREFEDFFQIIPVLGELP